ncbi:MAG: HEAT repeat domain-containing protein [Candidatus Anstonellales archaeon]
MASKRLGKDEQKEKHLDEDEFPLSGLLEESHLNKEQLAEKIISMIKNKEFKEVKLLSRKVAEISHIEGTSAQAARVFRELLNNMSSTETRVFAVNGLTRLIELGSKDAVKAIVDALTDPIQGTREAAALSISKTSAQWFTLAPESMVILRASLSDESVYVKEKIVLALANLGVNGNLEAIGILAEGLISKDAEARILSARAMAYISCNVLLPQNAIEAVSSLIDDPIYEIRKEALTAIGNAAERGADIKTIIASKIKEMAISEGKNDELQKIAQEAHRKICASLANKDERELAKYIADTD